MATETETPETVTVTSVDAAELERRGQSFMTELDEMILVVLKHAPSPDSNVLRLRDGLQQSLRDLLRDQAEYSSRQTRNRILRELRAKLDSF